MIEKTIRCAKLVAQGCVLPVLLCVGNANALGLGDIKVSSYLGEPLKAQVPVIELPSDDTQEIKVRLASMDEYQRHKLHYPSGVSFKFELIKNSGKPYIKISSLSAIEEPFLDLLVEFSSSAGKITRGYTFLVDPAPGLLQRESSQTVETPVAVIAPPAELSPAGRFIFNQGDAKYTESPKADTPKRKKKSKVRPESGFVIADVDTAGVGVAKTTSKTKSRSKSGVKRFGKMSMSLSTSLSISKSDPGRQASGDALQEELIAKEKQLKELTSTPATKVPAKPVTSVAAGSTAGKPTATPVVVAAGTTAAPAPATLPEVPVVVPEPMGGGTATSEPMLVTPLEAASDAAAVSVVENAVSNEPLEVEPVPVVTAPPQVVGDAPSLLQMLNNYWQIGVAGLVLFLAGAIGFIFYRKRSQPGAGNKAVAWNQGGAKTTAKSSVAAASSATMPQAKSVKEKSAGPSLAERAKSLFAGGAKKTKTPLQTKSAVGASKPSVQGDSSAVPVTPIVKSAVDPVATPSISEPTRVVPELAPSAAAPVVSEGSYRMPESEEVAEPRPKQVIEEMEWDYDPKASPASAVKPAPVVESKPAIKTVQAASNGPALKVAEKAKPVVETAASPEYDLLEEADIYLRFGHTKLAEEVLREAIKMNNRNPQSFLALLGVLEGKGDAREFAEFAQQLKKLGDEASWQKAAEMGRKLDPANSLYA